MHRPVASHLSRCGFCGRIMVRRSELSERLCVACAEAMRAVASAAASEARVRAELYGPTGHGVVAAGARATDDLG